MTGKAQKQSQPSERYGLRAMGILRIGAIAVLTTVSVPLCAQATGSTAPAPARSWVSAAVRPALAQVGETVGQVNVQRWKVRRNVRQVMNGDIESIQQDLSGTLAGLLEKADAAPGSIPAAFAVYRNVDALYDTLLRVVETADFAAPRDEAEELVTTLNRLESARTALGDGILSGAQTQQAEVFRLRSALETALQHQQVKTTVVNNSPETRYAERRRAAERRAHHDSRYKGKKKEPAKKEPPRP